MKNGNVDTMFKEMSYEMLKDIMGLTNNPASTISRMLEELREITGAKLLAIYKHPEGTDEDAVHEHKLVDYLPKRRQKQLMSIEVEALFDLVHRKKKIILINEDNEPQLLEMTARQGFEISIILPLFSQQEIYGAILIFGLPTKFNLDLIVEGLDTLSNIFTLVIKYSLMYSNMESMIEERSLALRKSESKFRLLFKSAPIGIYLGDKKGNILEANKRLIKILGSPSVEATKQINLLEFPPLVNNGYAEKYRQCFMSGDSMEFEMPYTTRWGKKTFLRSFMVPLKNEKDEIESIYTLLEDVTDRKRSETIQNVLYNISNASLKSIGLDRLYKEIEEELKRIIDTTNFHIALYNTMKSKWEINYSTHEVNSQTFKNWSILFDRVMRSKESLFIDSSEAAGILGQRNKNAKRPEKVPREWLGIPLKVSNLVFGVMVFQNFSEEQAIDFEDKKFMEFVSDQVSQSIFRKRSEDELRKALVRATESDRLKSTFLATMSHELRTPLNAIIGFSDIIDEDSTMDEVLNYNKVINNSGVHLLSLVNDLFDISLIQSGAVNISIDEVSLNEVLENVYSIVGITKKEMDRVDIKLQLDIPNQKEDVKINTDLNKLKQILINLIKNALKFTKKGGITFGYQKIEGAGNKVEFFVKDTGIGIPKDKLERIFNLFEKIEDFQSKNYGGTGIGLSVAKSLTNLLGGDIWVESEVDKGSTFFFTIESIQV